MKIERRTTKIIVAIALALALALGTTSHVARAATKNVTFGWEDGTSTASLGQFIPTPDTSAITYANVATGNITDFGPSGDPFPVPVDFPVTPHEGSRMLEITAVIDDELNGGSDGSVYLGIIKNLDAGDTYEFSFRAYDPTADRSPSVPPNATFSNTADLNMFDGFAVPLQPFSNIPGTGWLLSELDADGSTTPAIVTPITFNPIDSISDAANAVRLEANLFYQSLTGSSGDGTEEFYIDDVSITVTSDNPAAEICLPDGTCVLVNEPSGVPGDFNEDDKVDAADYVVWRQNDGPNSPLPNDNGLTTQADRYNLWVDNFSEMAGSGGRAVGAVPEPGSLLLVAMGMMGLGFGRRRTRS